MSKQHGKKQRKVFDLFLLFMTYIKQVMYSTTGLSHDASELNNKEYVIYGNSCEFPLHTKAQILFSLEKLLTHIRLNRIVRLLRFSRARASITQHRLARQKTCFSRKYRLLFAIYISSLKFGRTLRFLSTKQLILRSYVEKCVLHPFFSNRGKT